MRMLLSLFVLATLATVAQAGPCRDRRAERKAARVGHCEATVQAVQAPAPVPPAKAGPAVAAPVITLGPSCANGSCQPTTRTGVFGRRR